MTTTRRGILAASGALLAAPQIAPSLAQTARWPERPVEITVGFIAGGATDLDARLFARLLEPRIGGTVVVINRAGAGGEVALGAVARARPDGHSLATTNMPGFLTIPIERQAQYRLEDFTGIANLVIDPCAVTVHEQSAYRNLQQLIDAAKARPETITFASPGVGTDDHLTMVLIQEATGARFTHVVFQGDPQLRTAILGRQVDAMGLNVGPVTATPDNLRMLAQAGAERSRFRPDVPTLRELGISVEMASERGLVAPAGTPPAIVAKLREAAADIARDPEFIRVLESRFTFPSFEGGDGWFRRLAATRTRYQELWQKTPWSQR